MSPELPARERFNSEDAAKTVPLFRGLEWFLSRSHGVSATALTGWALDSQTNAPKSLV